MKRKFLFFGVFVGVLVGFFILSSFSKKESQEKREIIIVFQNTTIQAEVADTPKLRIQGLSGHAPLSEGRGMWFDFGVQGIHGIWMKEMSFPLDILWFNEEFRIVHIKENAKPSSYPEIFTPPSSARYVLEVSAGFVAKSGASLGDRVSIHSPR